MKSLGRHLKVQRKLRGITLEEVSLYTKISPNWLLLLEENRFDQLPGEIFTKGYLRLYAEAVGMDPDDVVLRYEVHARKEEAGVYRPRWWKRKEFWKVVALLAGLVVLGYWVVSRVACAPQLTRHL